VTLGDLKADAEGAQAKGHEYMILVLHRSTEPRGQYVRLLGRAGPRGRFVGAERTVNGWVKVIADFKTADILGWLASQETKQGAGE
jgi:hypothetical protein